MLKSKQRKGGYIAPYSSSPNSSEYMLNSTVNADAIANINYANNKAESPELYVPPTATPIFATQNTPGIQGGSNKNKLNAYDRMQLEDNFLYSLEGGCACNSGGGCGAKYKKGGDVVLTPFISALALLGARMLADKNSGFNFSELFGSDKNDDDDDDDYERKKGGSNKIKSRKYRAGSACARSPSCY